jgi:glutathione synthase/RimK-type ligase-like ATP-grasp enzyme
VAETFRTIVYNENNEISRSFLLGLSKWPVLDSYEAVERAESKTLQLEYAVQLGLLIPSTQICNSLKQAKAFMQEKNKRYITKLLRPVSWSMNGEEDFFYTSFFTKNDLQASHFSVHPVLIQEFIPKHYELRVIYVGGKFFTGKIIVEEYEADWRRPGKVKSWHHYTLPVQVCKKLHMLMKKLGLNFGAIDMIRGSDGLYYFLEVNPIGEWGMLEKFLGLPISAAIAAHLIKISGNE